MRITVNGEPPARTRSGPHRSRNQWIGRSGKRYPYRDMAMEDVRASDPVVVVLAKAEAGGGFRAAWLGCANDPDFRAARAACRQLGRCRAQVHVPEEPADTGRIVRDLADGHPAS